MNPLPLEHPSGEPTELEPETDANGPEHWPHQCDNHPGLPAWSACAKCGRFLCRDCRIVPPNDSLAWCQNCLAGEMKERVIDAHIQRAAEQGHDINAEDLKIQTVELGEWEAKRFTDLLGVLKRVVLSPGRFFMQMHPSRGTGWAFLFGLFFGSLGLFFSLAWMSGSPEFEAGIAELMTNFDIPRDVVFLVMVLSLPLVVGLQIGLHAVGIGLLIALFRAPNRGMTATVKVVSYAMVSNLGMAIPSIGSIVTLVWFVLLLMSGTRRVHQLPIEKAIWIVGIPVVLLSMLGVFAFGG